MTGRQQVRSSWRVTWREVIVPLLTGRDSASDCGPTAADDRSLWQRFDQRPVKYEVSST